MRFLILLITMCLLSAATYAEDQPATAPPTRVIIKVHGERVEYDGEMRTVAVQGQVQITAQSDRPGAPTLAMTADEVEGDLANGILVAHGGIKLLSQQGALKGDSVRINVKTDQFVMENGAAEIRSESKQYPGNTVRGYLLGDRVCREGEIIFVIEGRVTTCDRARPHYSIGARKLTYNLTKQELRIERGHLTLYGNRLVMPADLTLPMGESARGDLIIPLPQYSSYDGLYVSPSKHMEWEGNPWVFDAYVHVGTTLRFPAGLTISNEGDQGLFTASLVRRQQEVWDFDQRSRVDYLPELRYLHHLQPTTTDTSPLDAEIFAGYLAEYHEHETTREASRAGLALHYSPMPERRQKHDGWWAATDLYQTFYSTGDHLTDWRLEAGVGRRLSERVAGALWTVHHESTGESPFYFDDVYSDNEGFGSLDLQLDRLNRLELYGHYDFDRSEIRDYSVKISHRVHCLTWSLQYSYAHQAVTVGVDLNGLTGGTRPVDSTPLVRLEEMPPLPEPVPDPGPETTPPAP
ncbi:hypothetical protein LLH23_23910 [bacterium]|nr:hypothetical protein [bacterium]